MDSDTDSLERTIQNDTSSHAMGNIKSEPEEDPLEGSSYNLEMSMKAETTNEEDDDEEYNTMALLELAQCVQTNHDPIEFDSTEAAVNPKTGLMMCLHCYEDVDSNLLADHMINAHSYRRLQLKCRICDTTFQERKVLIIHRKECQPPAKKAKRRTFQQIMREVESSLDTNIYDMVTCPICVLEMAKYTLKDHLINAHSNPDMFTQNKQLCYICEKQMTSFMHLLDNLQLAVDVQRVFIRADMCNEYRDPDDISQLPPDPCDTKHTDHNDIEMVFNGKDKQIHTKDITQFDQIDLPVILPDSNMILTLGSDNKLYIVPAPVDETKDINIDNENITSEHNDIKNIQKEELTWQEKSKNVLNFNFKRPQLLPKRVKRSQDETIVKRTKNSNLPFIVDCRTDSTAFNEEIKEEIIEPEVVEHPIRTDSAVDWEDKIPMEVISFMDDGDDGVNSTAARRKRQLKTNQIECIDLC
ncbi:hypothetical protein RR46_02546 [Papilio xuthus]|uniref:Uncharacterized protein n=1 Tax=Papilio xuthus TaxID=66420 RepID=A0A194Q237_PAPXU|nr:hypothetical protein RR46_02546 [Papilio xuthus]